MKVRHGFICDCDDLPLDQWVPCCPECLTPLTASTVRGAEDLAVCTSRLAGLLCTYDLKYVQPSDWYWKHRTEFDGADLPSNPPRFPLSLQETTP